jgi:hypothetical protein
MKDLLNKLDNISPLEQFHLLLVMISGIVVFAVLLYFIRKAFIRAFNSIKPKTSFFKDRYDGR